MTDGEFTEIATTAKKLAGLSITNEKRNLIYSRLVKRLRLLKLSSFTAYLQVLTGQNATQEVAAFVSALTTNVTAFFREPHHFEHFSTKVMPGLKEKAVKGEKVRLWSSACATGPEAYSLAIAVLEAFPDADKFDVKILATDIDPVVLNTARSGTYSVDDIQEIGQQRMESFFSKLDDDKFEAKQTIKRLITFRQLNLMGSWPFQGSFDAIFCRNVAIYFDSETQTKLWARLEGRLKPNGHLYIGHSERLSGTAAARLTNTGVTQFLKPPTKTENHDDERAI